MTWIENIMKWINILVHVNIGLVEAHSLVEFPSFPGLVPALPIFPDRAATLDDYHSV